MRQYCRCFAVFLPCFLLLLMVLFRVSSPAQAQSATGATKIGTHLIQGDYNAQADVVNQLKSSGVLSVNPSYPIVVMVDPANPGGLSIVKNAIGDSGFLTILRINVNEKTTSSQVSATIAAIKDNFGTKKTPIVVGNEINNQDAEWKSQSYSAYGQMFTAICSAFRDRPCGISALDTINSVFDAEAILPKILGSIGDKSLITAVFANVYKTGGCKYTSTRCDVSAGAWTQSKIKSGVPLYITEFGITQDLCGDFDCLQSFYEENNDVSATAIVGFTRNPTNHEANNSDWYHTVPAICEYWKAGALGQVEKPSKCGGGKRQSFVYPGIEDMAPDEGRMRSMAAGYQLMCGNQFKVQGDIMNEDAISKYNEHVADYQKIDCKKTPLNSACMVGGVFGNIILDNTKTVIPLYRFQGASVPNPESADRRRDDLEGFFGANYTKDQIENAVGGEEFLPPLANGVARKLVGQDVQCSMTVQYLKTIKQLCDQEGNRNSYTYNDKLDADASPIPKATLPPGDCALYAKIPGAAPQYDTYKKILDQMPQNLDCTAPEKAPPAWYKEFSKIELSNPKGFKPAYLVHYIDRPEEQPTSLEKRVNWNAPGEDDSTTNDPRNVADRIKIVKVYVPAGFAETNIDEVNSNPDLKDGQKQDSYFPTFTGGFMQTIQSVLPHEFQTKVVSDRIVKVQSIVKDMASGSIFDGAHGGIVCKTCNNLAPQNPLDPRYTIIRRINAEFLDPSSTTCSRDDFIGETAKNHVHTINPAGTLDPVKPVKITASATLIAQRDGSEQETIRTYLLLPEEFRNVSEYEKAFLNTFLSNDEQDITNHPEFEFISTKADKNAKPLAAYKFLQLTGSSADMISPTVEGATIRYYEPDSGAPPVYDPTTGNTTPAMRPVDAKLSGRITADRGVSEIKPDPLVPGGILARTLWQIMCNVTRPFDNVPTAAYSGFEKFLDKGMAACTEGSQPLASAPPTDTNDYLATEVAKCNGTSGGITPGNRIPIVNASYTCTASDGPANIVGTPASLFTSNLDVPAWKSGNDGDESLCDENFYSFVACSYSPSRGAPKYTLIAHKVDESGTYTSTGTMTACQYVVRQAKSRGVSPRLALAIWGDESGFGSYDVADFGVISVGGSRSTGKISTQVAPFINTLLGKSTYLSFLRQYSGEKTPTDTNFCNNKQFPYRVKDFYNDIR